MIEKVRMPKDVADEIERIRQKLPNADQYLLSLAFRYDHGKEGYSLFSFAQEHYDDYVQAIVNGYTTNTPEDNVREYYNKFRIGQYPDEGYRYAILRTLALLEIKIEGVNA